MLLNEYLNLDEEKELSVILIDSSDKFIGYYETTEKVPSELLYFSVDLVSSHALTNAQIFKFRDKYENLLKEADKKNKKKTKNLHKLNKILLNSKDLIIYDDFKVIITENKKYYYISSDDEFYELQLIDKEFVSCDLTDDYYLTKFPKADVTGEAFADPIYYWFKRK